MNGYDDYLTFLEELEFLREHTTLNPISYAKIKYINKNTRNKRNAENMEYKYRYKAWENKYKHMWESLNYGDKENESLYDFAHGALIQQMAYAKEELNESRSR